MRNNTIPDDSADIEDLVSLLLPNGSVHPHLAEENLGDEAAFVHIREDPDYM